MAASAATVAFLSRGGGGPGGGIFNLTSALALRRTTSNNAYLRFLSVSASASASASATILSPRRHTRSPALLFPASPPLPQPSRRRCQFSCSVSHAPSQQESAAAPVVDAAAAPPSPDPAPVVPSDPVREAAALLDIRVGRVLRAWRHPEADSLYVEEVDVGEDEPRTICSGLVAYVPLEALEGARVLVLANLKARNMRGVKSNGMLLAASDASHEKVELLAAPEGAIPGERVWFSAEGHNEEQPEPATPNQVQKKKIWEFVQPHLKTDENFVATLGECPMQTSAGVVVCKSLKNASIS